MAAQWTESCRLPLCSLNHISLNCKDVQESLEFYKNVLGFVEIKRPGSLQFDGAWLFNYGLGIHLIKSESTNFCPKNMDVINPKADHISFQCTDISLVEDALLQSGLKFVRQTVEEGVQRVKQLFIHDPDGHMIEICNCDILPIIPLSKPSPAPSSGHYCPEWLCPSTMARIKL
eukprot:TRINITY_DN2116_c0_g1_i3.p1 TRINITY_DN2116_c0_g1~~TRINITY_DN2116_c0_g1_i3.p1  ORF type:complete len:174 (-),score=34.22 TRINITY_DN2116_c0_g1_i3:266-787(-)